jgi:hypothetical protein
MMMGLMATITHVYRNHPGWKAVFEQFAPDIAGKHVPDTVMIRGAAIENIRRATVENLKQFMRESIEGTHRMRSPF